jgi:hypothetical protein
MKYFHHYSFSCTINTPFTIYGAFDRSRSLIDIPNIECITPIGEAVQPKSVDQLCYDSAKHIIDSSGDKKLSVFWSGGIDSTLVLAELLKITTPDKLVVVMNNNSIREYPDFYTKYIEDKLEVKQFSLYNGDYSYLLKDSVLVSGHLMDSNYGPILYPAIPIDVLKQSIPEFLSKLSNTSIELYKKLISGCPRKIENVKDLFWWFEYAVNYQNEQLSMILETEDLVIDKNIFYFSCSKDWNDYSVSTPIEEKWFGYDYRDFKMPLKQQLYKFTKDTYYTENKIKVPSWRRYRTGLQRKKEPVYINTDWVRGWGVRSFK